MISLVTGGCGFIGSNLCKTLLDLGEDVICVDNNFSSKKSNIYHLQDYKSFEYIRHDITFPLYLEVDLIYNLACPASPLNYQRDPIFTTKTCVNGSINMLGLAKRLDCKILLSSTSEVYGDPEIHPQDESYKGSVNPIGIRSCYDEGKRCAETLFFDYYRQYNLDIKIARIFNTYGPKMAVNDGRVISNFIVNALQNKDLIIYGNGEKTRSFCYVSDTVDGLIKLMNSKETGPINIGNPIEYTINQLANIIIDLTKSKSSINYIDNLADDPFKRKPDITLAQNKLNWEPQVNLIRGLNSTIEYYKDFIK